MIFRYCCVYKVRIQSLYKLHSCAYISYIVRDRSNYKYFFDNLLLLLGISRISPYTILVGMVTKLRATWSGIWISFSKSSRQILWPTKLHIPRVPAGKAEGAWNLVTHFHLVLWLRMRGAIPLLFLYAFIHWFVFVDPSLVCNHWI